MGKTHNTTLKPQIPDPKPKMAWYPMQPVFAVNGPSFQVGWGLNWNPNHCTLKPEANFHFTLQFLYYLISL